MKKLFSLYILFFSFLCSAQTDYSDSWEDFYSYNNVKDLVKVDNVIYIPYNETYNSVLIIIQLQMLAYKLSVTRGINPDMPKNLAKVVTVE